MKILYVPVRSNHNQTLFLFALSMTEIGKKDMVFYPTDFVADAVVRRLANELGITLISQEESLKNQYDVVYLHGWNVDPVLLSSVKAEAFFIYADGLSNRSAFPNEKDFQGLVFWGSEILDKGILEPALQIQSKFVSNNLVAEVWKSIFQTVKLPPLTLDLNEGSPFVAFRYWGSSTYLGLTTRDIRDSIISAFSDSPDSDTVYFAADSRWRLPHSQKHVLSTVFEDRRLVEFQLPAVWRRKLGHFANLDAALYSTAFPEIKFYGFDGSLPITFLLNQSQTKVLVPTWRPPGDLPSQKLVTENLDWHSELLEKSIHYKEKFSKLNPSKVLIEALCLVRTGETPPPEYLGKIVLALHDDWGDSSRSAVDEVSRLIMSNASRATNIFSARKLANLLRESSIATRVFYYLVRFLPLRKILVKISSLLR